MSENRNGADKESKEKVENTKESKQKVITEGANSNDENEQAAATTNNDFIEEQMGGLPEFVSDDEKPEMKPVIKQEPCTISTLNVDKLIQEVNEATYTQCEFHKMERMEKNVVCIQCEQLICALCLLNSHQAHEIRSVISLKEYFKVKNSMEDDVSVLQQEQNTLSEHFRERKELKKKIEESSNNLVQDISRGFKTINNILHAKQEQLIKYVRQFEYLNVAELNKELDTIRDLSDAASRMITRAITFFSKIDLQEALDLPVKLVEVINRCKEAKIKGLENKDKYLPEKKFSKLLPSLDAVANICDTIHAEATKVVWSKTTKNSETDDKGKVKVEKRKHHSHSDHSSENSKTFKKPKISSSSTSSSVSSTSTAPTTSTTSTISATSTTSLSPSSLPVLAVPRNHRSSTEKSDEIDKTKKNSEKSLFESLSENVNMKEVTANKVTHRKKSLETAASVTQSPRVSSELEDSESDRSETSTVSPPKLKLVEMKATNIDIGKCLLAKINDEDGERIVLGKILSSSKMKDTTQYTVNLLKGEPGKDIAFDLRKKQTPVHSSCVICNFDFDHNKPMSIELQTELVMAKEYHSNRKKTRQRKSVLTKDKSASSKKDKDCNKTQVLTKK